MALISEMALARPKRQKKLPPQLTPRALDVLARRAAMVRKGSCMVVEEGWGIDLILVRMFQKGGKDSCCE